MKNTFSDTKEKQTEKQLTTFFVGPELFGIDVMKVQEVTSRLEIMNVPISPDFVKGLINLRGQIATAIGLQELLHIETIEKKNEGQEKQEDADQMSVICKIDENLVSLVVDVIGDVVEVDSSTLEDVPETVNGNVKKFLKGVYKLNGLLLSVIDLDAISRELSPEV